MTEPKPRDMTSPKDVFAVDRKQRLIYQIEDEFYKFVRMNGGKCKEDVNVINLAVDPNDDYLLSETVQAVCDLYMTERNWSKVTFRRDGSKILIFTFIA